ncbi:MAG: hypothetical protein Q9226_007445 [Calogaya cf. arnoldii]
MAEIVYTAVTDATGINGSLFQGAKFWLSQKVPQRTRFIEEVKANGGEVTPLEKEADVKIVDHARKQQLPGTYSYQYIEDSVRNGALEDLEKHAVGPPVGTIRAVGSVIQPAKSTRTKFTAQDDQQLVSWVRTFEQRGGATSGNEIYKQLEAKAWRDRWVKTLKYLPPSAFVSHDAPPTPPADQRVEDSKPSIDVEERIVARKPFTKEDGQSLLSVGHDIEKIDPDNKQQAWLEWAENQDHPEDHSAEDWEDLWERTIRPLFRKQRQRIEEKPIPQGPVDSEANRYGHGETQEEASLPVRNSPAKKNAPEPTIPRSPSYHPESPTRQLRTASQERNSIIPAADDMDGANDAKDVFRSPVKRKRPAYEEGEEVPSSSPMQLEVPNKRLRRDSLPHEILSSPGNASAKVSAKEVPDTYATTNAAVIDVIEISDGDDADPLEEGLFCSEEERSLSPELGSSPKIASTSLDRNVSKTQAAFLDPTPSIEYDLAEPENGWQDEDQYQDDEYDEENNEENDDDDQSNDNGNGNVGLAYEEAAGFDLAAPEGGWPDENGDENEDESDDESDEEENSGQDKQAEYDRVLEEEVGGLIGTEGDYGDEPESDSQPENLSSEFDTQEKKLAERMGMRARSSSLSSSSTATSRNPSPTPVQHTTQGILTAQTQEPDLSLAEPEGGWDQVLSSPPVSPSFLKPNLHQSQVNGKQQQSPENPEPEQNYADNVDNFIAYMIAQGHDEDDILLALRYTNMDHILTEKALVYIETHPRDTIPNMRGFWTEKDDADLRGNNASKIKALELKHGKESVELRWEFLEHYGS